MVTNMTAQQTPDFLTEAKNRLQRLRDGNAYYEGDDDEGFAYVDGYLAACRDFEDLLNDVLPASTETTPVLPYYEVAAALHGSDERVLYTSLSDAYSTAHALTRHYDTVRVWNGKTLHCSYDKADGQWKALTPEAKELEAEWDEHVSEAQANPDRPRKPLPLWFLHR